MTALVTRSMPLRRGLDIAVALPADLTSAEAKRLAAWIGTLWVDGPNDRESAPDRRLHPNKPSPEVLRAWYLDEGQSQAHIANQVGTTVQSVRAWLRDAAIPIRTTIEAGRLTGSANRPDPDSLRRLYDAGATKQEMAERFDVSHDTITRWMRAAAIPARRPGPPKRSADMGSLADRLKSLRQRRGLSLSALAGAAGVSKGYLSQIERGPANGNGSRPSAKTLQALASALEVNVAELAGGNRRAHGT